MTRVVWTSRGMGLWLSLAPLLGMMLLTGCAKRTPAPPAPSAKSDGVFSLPTMGVSMPAPRGWTRSPTWVGTIGAEFISVWVKRSPEDPERAIAAISLVRVVPRSGWESPNQVTTTTGPVIGGKPSTLVRGRAIEKQIGPSLFDPPFVEGYCFEHGGMLFYLLHVSLDADQTRGEFEAVARGMKWSKPLPAHSGLAMTGRRHPLCRDNGLSYEVPDPFMENPFRGEHVVSSLESESPDREFAVIEVDSLDGVNSATDAMATAMSDTAGDAAGESEAPRVPLQWRKVSAEPEVYVSAMADPQRKNLAITHCKFIVARCPDGTWLRLSFGYDGPAEHAGVYDAIIDQVATSISTQPLTKVPEFPARGR